MKVLSENLLTALLPGLPSMLVHNSPSQNSSFKLLVSMKNKPLFLLLKTNEIKKPNGEFINSYQANIATRFHTSRFRTRHKNFRRMFCTV